MNKLENILEVSKINELLGKKEEKKKCNVLLWVLAIIGAVAAVAAIAYAVYRYLTPDYLEDFEDETEGEDLPDEETDELPDTEDEDPGSDDGEALDGVTAEEIAQAISIIRMENKASVSLLQRRMNIGYATAAKIIDALEEQGVVGPYNGSQPREVLPFDKPEEEVADNG